MPTTKPILAFTLLLSVGAFAAECDEAHKYQHCQLPVLKKIAGLVTTVGYTEGVCYPIVIDDEGGSSSGEPEVVQSQTLSLTIMANQYAYICASTGKLTG